jgi:hypothetical protein
MGSRKNSRHIDDYRQDVDPRVNQGILVGTIMPRNSAREQWEKPRQCQDAETQTQTHMLPDSMVKPTQTKTKWDRQIRPTSFDKCVFQRGALPRMFVEILERRTEANGAKEK